MRFELSENQNMIQEQVRRFATNRLAPLAHTSLPIKDLLSEIYDLGLRGPRVSFDFDGLSMDAISDVIIIEELAKQDAGLALMLAMHNLGAFTLGLIEHPWTTQFTTGDQWLGVAFIDAPENSDALDLTLDFVAGAQHLTHMLLISHEQILLTPLSHQSVTRTVLDSPLGLRAIEPCSIEFNNTPAQTLQVFGHNSNQEDVELSLLHATHHAHLAAICTGLAQSAYLAGATYAYERKQFNRRLTDFQVTQFKLANMATQNTAAKHLLYYAAHCIDTTQMNAASQALLAHSRAIKSAKDTTDEALQLHGGYGYTQEYIIERHYRDIVALSALSGGRRKANLRAGELLLETLVQ